MKFVTVARDSSKDGAAQLQFSLPNSVRTLYTSDPVRCEDWKKLIMDFDAKLLALNNSNWFVSPAYEVKVNSMSTTSPTS